MKNSKKKKPKERNNSKKKKSNEKILPLRVLGMPNDASPL